MSKIKILTVFWHSVDSDAFSPDQTNPNTTLFREHIKFFIENYTPINIADFLQIQRGIKSFRSYRKAPVLLGFDDGFRNVLRYALPVLEEFEVPAVFFVIGEIFKNSNFVPWYVERKHLMRKTARKTVSYRNTVIDLSLQEDRNKLKRLFDACFKACTSEIDRQNAMAGFANLLGVDRPTGADLDEDLKFVDPKDLANLPASSLLTVGSHAMTHRDLATLSYDDQLNELKESDLLLRKHCPSYRAVIAYPSGSFNGGTVIIAKRLYEFGFATILGSYRNNCAYRRICLGRHSIKEVAYAVSPTRINYILPLKRYLNHAGIHV